MVAPDPDPRDADVDPPGIGLTVPGGRGWRVGRRAHSLGRIMEMELRYSLVRGQSRRRSAAAAAASSSSPSAAHLYVMRVKPTWRGTENDVDLALSLGMQRIVHVWINETWPGEISARPMDMIALQAQ